MIGELHNRVPRRIVVSFCGGFRDGEILSSDDSADDVWTAERVYRYTRGIIGREFRVLSGPGRREMRTGDAHSICCGTSDIYTLTRSSEDESGTVTLTLNCKRG